MRIESVQVGSPVRVAGMRTGFGKRPVSGPVRIGRTNLDGDGQGDRRYHGGVDMAVLACSADHYSLWRRELAWPELPCGGFAENLSVSGATEATVCIGDVWRAGTALLQVASPRKPCRKIAAYWNRPALLDLAVRSGRIGWYLRVLEEGVVRSGATVALIERPFPAWTVERAFAAARARRGAEAHALAGVSALSDRWKKWLRGAPARV